MCPIIKHYIINKHFNIARNGPVGYCRLNMINNYSTPTVTKFSIAFWLYSE